MQKTEGAVAHQGIKLHVIDGPGPESFLEYLFPLELDKIKDRAGQQHYDRCYQEGEKQHYFIADLQVGSLGAFFQHITHSHLGINELGRKVFFNFFPKEIDVHVDDIRFGIEVYVPDIHGNVDAGDDLVLIADEIFQQLEFLCCEGDIPAFPRDLLAVQVHDQIADLKYIGAGGGLMMKSFEEGPDTNQQLLEIEWFDNIVICTCLEALDLVFCRIHGGADYDENFFFFVSDMAWQFILHTFSWILRYGNK